VQRHPLPLSFLKVLYRNLKGDHYDDWWSRTCWEVFRQHAYDKSH
jgi:hypothetical protein